MLNQINITFCAHDRPKYYAGGPNAWLRRLLVDLREHDIMGSVLFMNHDGDCPNIKAIESEGFKCKSIDVKVVTETKVRWMLKQIQEFKTDVFVPNVCIAGYYAARWIRESGIPTIGVLHSDDDHYRGIQDIINVRLGGHSLSAVVCVSEFLRTQVASQVDNTQMIVSRIPCGVSVPVQTHSIRSKLRVAYVGRLVNKQKRISDVAMAMCMAAKRVPNTEYIIIGEGPERECVEGIIAQYGQGLPVKLLGSFDNDEIMNLYRDIHVIMLLSDYEGVPIALMEAMAHGAVPVCLDIASGIPELIRHNETGLIVQNRHSEFITAINKLASEHRTWQMLSHNARTLIESEYSSSICTAKWVDLIRQLAVESYPRTRINIPKRLKLPTRHSNHVHEDIRKYAVKDLMCKLRDHSLNTNLFGTCSSAMSAPAFEEMGKSLFVYRHLAFQEILANAKILKGTVLEICSSPSLYRSMVLSRSQAKQYIILNEIDANYQMSLDNRLSDRIIALDDASVDGVIYDHINTQFGRIEQLLSEIHRVLRVDGLMILVAPSLLPMRDIWLHEHNITPYSIQNCFMGAGFTDVNIRPMGGWDASLAHVIGMWVSHRPFSTWKRTVLTAMLRPFVARLYKSKTNAVEAYRSGLTPGYLVIARKSDVDDLQS